MFTAIWITAVVVALLAAFFAFRTIYIVRKYGPPIRRIFEESPLFAPTEGVPHPASEEVEFSTADGLTLRALDATQLRREMEFFYPLHNLHANRLDALLPGRNNNNTDPDRLRFLPVSGLMHGFIDLVFAHNGRYYLADWKSNWLGPTAADYGTEQLTRAINEHHYDLQYCVYSVALHHYLQARIPDYDIDRHFGGVYYFFLRGMRPAAVSADGPATGVYFRRAPRAEILSLAAIMRNETTP